MNPISAVILTLNEERNIERCIHSLHGVADEIVVIDSFSEDNTRNICEKLGVRFIQHKFEGYIEQKNWAITQAGFPHVLSLDADEALSQELKQSIIRVKENMTADGYYFNRLNNYCGKWIKHCGWYPDRKLRLWDSRKGKWTGINPHDKYELNQGSVENFLEGDLLHYSYYTIYQHVEQANKFSEIQAKDYFNNGKSTNIFDILIRPAWKFLRCYIINAGFLDGFYGFVICMITAHSTFLKYAKLRQLIKKISA